MTPEQRLIVGIFRQAVNDMDTYYFNSDMFEHHCNLISWVNPEAAKRHYLNHIRLGNKLKVATYNEVILG